MHLSLVQRIFITLTDTFPWRGIYSEIRHTCYFNDFNLQNRFVIGIINKVLWVNLLKNKVNLLINHFKTILSSICSFCYVSIKTFWGYMYSKLSRVSHWFSCVYIYIYICGIYYKEYLKNWMEVILNLSWSGPLLFWAILSYKHTQPLRSTTAQRLQETTRTLLFTLVPPAIPGFFCVCIVSLFSQECFFQQHHLQHIEYWSVLPSNLPSSSWSAGVTEMQRSPGTCPQPHNESVCPRLAHSPAVLKKGNNFPVSLL